MFPPSSPPFPYAGLCPSSDNESLSVIDSIDPRARHRENRVVLRSIYHDEHSAVWREILVHLLDRECERDMTGLLPVIGDNERDPVIAKNSPQVIASFRAVGVLDHYPRGRRYIGKTPVKLA